MTGEAAPQGTRPCHFCQEPVDPRAPDAWQATSCFTKIGVRTRADGTAKGRSDRVVYRYLKQFAHESCVEAFKRGRLGQEGLGI